MRDRDPVGERRRAGQRRGPASSPRWRRPPRTAGRRRRPAARGTWGAAGARPCGLDRARPTRSRFRRARRRRRAPSVFVATSRRMLTDSALRAFGDPAVPDAGLGDDQLRRLRVVAELLAEGPHVGAQVGGLRAVPLAPDLAQEPLVGQELAGIRHERLEEPVLGGREVQRLAVARDEPPAEVDLERAVAHRRARAAPPGCARRIAARARASSSSIAERLRDVVVRAGVQGRDLVVLVRRGPTAR